MFYRYLYEWYVLADKPILIYSKDTITFLQILMKMIQFNQTEESLQSILWQNSATFLSTNER